MSKLLPPVAQLLADAAREPALPMDAGVAQLRAAADAGVLRRNALVRDAGALHEVVDLVSPAGVPVRLYRPTDAGELPLHVHLHGGGWWMGSIETVDPMARELAVVGGMAVLSVGYRLAPEHRWPAAPEDVFEVLHWASATDLGFTVSSLSLGGESAGGNLAAVAGLMCRDRGGPELAALWLDIPAVDLRLPPTPSASEFGTGYGVELAHLPMITGWYADDDQLDDPYLSPARADLRGLPPTIVTTAECDPVRDQGEQFAEALAAAGVHVTRRRAEGHIHASTWLTALDPSAGAWLDEMVHVLRGHHDALVRSA